METNGTNNVTAPVLSMAEQTKIWRLEAEAYKQKEYQKEFEHYTQFLDYNLDTIVSRKKCNYVENEYNELNQKTFEDIKKYFFNYKKDSVLNTKKGLCLYGDFGTGKTTIMKIFDDALREVDHYVEQKYEYIKQRKKYFITVSTNKILSDFLREGQDSIDNLTWRVTADRFYNEIQNLCIDDLADVKPVKYYGNEINLFDSLILDRYEIFKERGKITHITTNLTPKEIFESVNFRVSDRMKEMFNFVQINGKSLRQ